MKTFSIDLASHEGHLACVDGSAVRAIRTVGRVTDAEVVSLAEAVLADAGWKKEEIERVACNLGPGGFMSLRGGVAFANAIADRLGIPMAGYHGSSLAIARCGAAAGHALPQPNHGTKIDFWVHSTRQDQVFIAGGTWLEPTLAPLADVLGSVVPDTRVVGDLLDAHKTLLAERGATFPVPAALESVLPSFLAGLAYGKKTLVPWYGRGI